MRTPQYSKYYATFDKMDRSKLKGGLETRRNTNDFRKKFGAIKKACGCVLGEKCGEGCKDLTFVVKCDKVKHEPEKGKSDTESS